MALDAINSEILEIGSFKTAEGTLATGIVTVSSELPNPKILLSLVVRLYKILCIGKSQSSVLVLTIEENIGALVVVLSLIGL